MVKETQIVELANEDIAFAIPGKLEKSFSIDKSTEQVPEIFGSIDLTTGKYVWGYASVDITDSEGDRITLRALDKVKDDLVIAPYNKIFRSHNYTETAIGLIVATSMDSKGLIILAKLNEDHEKFREVWSSINNGFLDAFSIGGKFVTMERIWNEEQEVFNNVATEIEAMEVSLTSIPANPSAMLLGAFEKARKFIKLLNGKETLLNDDNYRVPEKMIEEEKETIETKEEVNEAVAVETETENDSNDVTTTNETNSEADIKTDSKEDDGEVVKSETETEKEAVTLNIPEEKQTPEGVLEILQESNPETTMEEVKTNDNVKDETTKEVVKENKEEETKEKEEEKESDDLIETKKTIEALTKAKDELEKEVQDLKAEIEVLKSKDEKGDEEPANADTKEEKKEDSSVATKEDKELEKTSEPLRKSIVLNKERLLTEKAESLTPILDMLRR